MRKPNFFIVGAPKCGTTSLAGWLAAHPLVYMHPRKEPHYFSADINFYGKPRSDPEYLQEFMGAGSHVQAIGDASTSYCYSAEAIRRIEKKIEGAKYIFMIRNPVDMAYALHAERIIRCEETISDFKMAWNLSPLRRQNLRVPSGCPDGKLLDYQYICKLGNHLSRLTKQVTSDRLLVILLDDIKINPRQEYLKVLQFLGLPDDNRTMFPVFNRSKEFTSTTMARLLYIIKTTYHWAGLPRLKMGLFDSLVKLSAVERPRKALSESFRREIWNYYREDVLYLSKFLERDLCALWAQKV